MQACSQPVAPQVELLAELRGDVNAASFQGVRPIHLAALQAPEIIDALVLAGAGIYQTDAKGNSAMHYACAGQQRGAEIPFKRAPLYIKRAHLRASFMYKAPL